LLSFIDTVFVQFDSGEATARWSWRQAILMGVNTRTYKFVLGAALLELASTGRDAVPLVELASTYASNLVNRAGSYPQASSKLELSDTDFLSVLSRERQASISENRPTEALVEAASRSIPVMVMQKFHNVPGSGEVAHTFYELEGRGRNRIVRLTPDLHKVARDGTEILNSELDARWTIVEASFDAGIGRSLLYEGVSVDIEAETIVTPVRRVALAHVKPVIVGFQHGRCFYCHQPFEDLGPTVHVDHVFPFHLMNSGSWRGPNLHGVWNLVISCADCNLKKWGRPPIDAELSQLLARNEAIAESQKPVARTLELATKKAAGASPQQKRYQFIRDVHNHMTGGSQRGFV
jgi:hypothetical protein